MKRLPRRGFLKALLAGSVALPYACGRPSPGPIRDVPARFVDRLHPAVGHLLRGSFDPADFSTARETTVDALVVGGGVSGLAACWKLRQAGVQRVLLVELASQLGGDATAGQAQGLEFPWGAHYINVPPAEADCVHEVLTDLEVITGYDGAGRPVIHPDHLLRWPAERLWEDDNWSAGLDPFGAASPGELEQLQAFEDDMLRWTLYRGQDSRRGFAMPLAYSTADARVRALDTMTMAQYSRQQGWSSPRLSWLIDQACKDDYGGIAADVSAWAGIHYFACRFYDRRLQEQYPSDTLTWPGGNQFLVDGMARNLSQDECWLSTAVVGLLPGATTTQALCFNIPSGEPLRVQASSVVYAGKLHTAPHVVVDMPKQQRQAIEELDYVPWLVAAVKLSSQLGDPGLAWDNILMDSPSVGYVSARHQTSPTAQPEGEVLVYYLPLIEDLVNTRKQLLEADPQPWANRVLADLTRVHPHLPDLVEGIDLCRWGHGMVRPAPGVIWGPGAEQRRQPCGRIAFASCDAGGLPLFEEALFAGIAAAEHCLDTLDMTYTTSLHGMPVHG
ncbi:MAG: NAD(P)-binding protein [Gemmatimonadetes bacterium]|jgi:protoporphyrinogen oxidase|nr:NAD(P)-binding protein [Gemmatimonadota bacterium]MBT7861018.1 NAD(P)-binding protein [Gemmatimonadota bacterium]